VLFAVGPSINPNEANPILFKLEKLERQMESLRGGDGMPDIRTLGQPYRLVEPYVDPYSNPAPFRAPAVSQPAYGSPQREQEYRRDTGFPLYKRITPIQYPNR